MTGAGIGGDEMGGGRDQGRDSHNRQLLPVIAGAWATV